MPHNLKFYEFVEKLVDILGTILENGDYIEFVYANHLVLTHESIEYYMDFAKTA